MNACQTLIIAGITAELDATQPIRNEIFRIGRAVERAPSRLALAQAAQPAGRMSIDWRKLASHIDFSAACRAMRALFFMPCMALSLMISREWSKEEPEREPKPQNAIRSGWAETQDRD